MRDIHITIFITILWYGVLRVPFAGKEGGMARS